MTRLTDALLLPCPFCGQNASVKRRTPLKSEWPKQLIWVQCERCGARTGEYDHEDETTERGYIQDWNRRTANPVASKPRVSE